jgi:5'-phosphate synthase pdxT subunit
LQKVDAIVLPGGESTAMGFLGKESGMWDALQTFIASGKPTWGTCAGMILLAEKCVGTSAVVEDGQALIGGMNILVCRNYFGSQISSFEMATPCPPGMEHNSAKNHSYPGIFIRAPGILTAGDDVDVLGKVTAIPCRQAAAVLSELDKKIARGEEVIEMHIVDTLHPKEKETIDNTTGAESTEEEKKEAPLCDNEVPSVVAAAKDTTNKGIVLPGAAEGTHAREIISAVQKGHVLCTAFHPELTQDYRWHEYFSEMVNKHYSP